MKRTHLAHDKYHGMVECICLRLRTCSMGYQDKTELEGVMSQNCDIDL